MGDTGSTKKRARRSGRGSLALIAVLFAGSAGLRVFLGASEVIAAQDSTPPSVPSSNPIIAAEQARQEEKERASKLLNSLLEREKAVEERERQVRMRIEAMSLAQEELDRSIAELTAAEQELRSTIALAEGAAERDIQQLITVYENMKPKDAAVLFEQMDPDFAAGFLGRMRPDAAAGIMTGLSPEVAYSISAILAGRNANVPKD